MEVRIADDNGKPITQGGEREILIRGPNVMKGYYNHPKEIAKALEVDWLHSGDVGRMDAEGYAIVSVRTCD